MPTIKTWKQANDYLLSGRNTECRRIPDLAETHVIRMPLGEIALRYHATSVVTWYQDGRIILNSGGFRTPTTKSRMNEFSPISIYQTDFTWFVVFGSGVDTHVERFIDGMNVGQKVLNLSRMQNVSLPL